MLCVHSVKVICTFNKNFGLKEWKWQNNSTENLLVGAQHLIFILQNDTRFNS